VPPFAVAKAILIGNVPIAVRDVNKRPSDASPLIGMMNRVSFNKACDENPGIANGHNGAG